MKHALPGHQPMNADETLHSLAAWLSQAAYPLGLTNYASLEDILRHGILPARLLPELLGAEPVGPWAEIGPGSGALGLALALQSPAAFCTLADRRARVTAFLDLTIRRLALPNASAMTIALSHQPGPSWLGVVFRAFAQPPAALQIAAAHAQRWICAWHSLDRAGYDMPPTGFLTVARAFAPTSALGATLYRRR